MSSTRKTTRLWAACAASALALVLPSAANAVVYCVPNDTIDPSCTTGEGLTTVQGALTAAVNSTAVPDTVRIGAGNFPITDGSYNDTANAANTVQVVGAGTGATTLTLGSTMNTHNTLFLNTLAGSTVSDLAITIPANVDGDADNGLVLGGQAVGRNILVNGPAAGNATGVMLGGTTTLDDSTVNLPFGSDNSGVRQNGGSPTITDSTIHAQYGVTHSGTGLTTTIDRSTVQASFSGVSLDSGTVNVRNSVIDLGANAAIGLDATNFNPGTAPKTLNADHVSVVGGVAGSIGFRVFATAAIAAQTSTGTLTNSVISGPARAISRQASNDGTPMMNSQANVTVGYSNYDASANLDINGMNGAGSITIDPAGTLTNLAPGFISPGTGDYHLMAGSPLLDIGDPAAPPGGELDIDGDARALSKAPSCTAPDPGRRDIGADEFVASQSDCAAPNTSVSGKKKVKSKKKRARVAFTLTATEAGATFECSIDGGAFRPCVSPFVIKLRRGTHTLIARAKDAAGNVDTSPATVTTKVVKSKRKKKK